MKRILLLFVFALLYNFAFSQFTVTQNLGSAVTLVNSKGGFKADSALILPSFSDTTAANRSPFIKYYAGNTIRVGDTVYIRNTTATKWINIGSGGGGSGYTTTYQLSDTSYRLVRPDNTADTFLYTSESIFDTTSLSNRINLKLNISDTSSMLSKYLRKTDTASLSNRINLKVNISDTSSMLTPYLRKVDTSSLSNRINLKVNISDTSSMLSPYLRKVDTTNKWVNNITRTPGKDSIIFFIGGTRYAIKDSTGGGGVTSVATGYGLSGGTITTTGTLIVDSATLSLKYLRKTDTAAMLNPYLRKIDTASLSSRINLKVNISDTSSMLTPYLRKVDTSSLSNRINLKLNISDTTAMLNPYLRKIDTTNKWVNNITRTLGKDSIIYFIGSNRYAIKDSVGTNPAPVGYYGAFQDTIDQTAAVINTGYPMLLRVDDLTNGVTIVSNSRITIANTGIYNLQWSAQFTNPTAAEHDVTIWLRKNGVDVPGSSGIVLVPAKHGAADGHTLPSWNFLLSAVGGDYYEFVWSTVNTSVYISFEPAGNPPPSTASVVLTVTQQSGIMAGTGMTALNGLSGAVQTFAVDSTNSTFKITSSGTTHTFNIPNASASGVTRGLISNTQYTTFNSKIGSGDTASMLTPYLRKIDTASLSSRINLKVNISDTSSMLTPYLRKIDTASLSSRINLKVNISDTATMLTPYSRKFAAAYTMKANNTNAAASEATQTFRDSTQKAYTGTITWTGTTAPSGTTNHTYQWSQIGKLVFLRINLDYSIVGVLLTQLIMTLPSDCPTPLIPTNVGATNVIVYCSGALTAQKTIAAATSQSPGFSALRINAAGTGYELILTRNAQAYQYAYITLQYFAQ